METIQQYRHIINSETREIFESALKKVVARKTPKKLGFIAVIKSSKKEYHHDIDVLIFPSKNAKIGEAFIELIKLYDKIEKEIKKKHPRYYLVTCPLMSMQQLIYYIASIEEGSAGIIPIHSLFFTNYRDFKKFNPINFQKEIRDKLLIIHGNFKVIKELKLIPQKNLNHIFSF